MKLEIVLIITILSAIAGGIYRKVRLAKTGTPSVQQSSFEDLLDAIEWVESKGDANAKGDPIMRTTGFPKYEEWTEYRAVGSFQIWKIYVDDVNRIQRLNHNS